MNKVFLSGIIAKDIEIKKVNDNMVVGKLTIAVHEYSQKEQKEITHFIPLTIFRKEENQLKYYTKGKAIEVEARISTRTIESEGKKMKFYDFIVDNIRFAPIGKKKETEYVSEAAASTEQVTQFEDFIEVEVDEEEMPF